MGWRTTKITPGTCGDKIRISKHSGGCGAHVAVPMTCGDRVLCVPCAKRSSARLARSLKPVLESIKHPRFMTLTLKNVPAGKLAEQQKHLRNSWQRLRRCQWWKGLVVGGVWTIEAVYNDKARTWHMHLHAVIDGNYMPQKELQDKWYAITGDSYIVDIRKADIETVSRELCKYVTKGWEIPEEQLQELRNCLHNRRRADTWGTCRNIKKPEKIPVKCPCCGEKYRFREWESNTVTRAEWIYAARQGILWHDYYEGWARDDPSEPNYDTPGN